MTPLVTSTLTLLESGARIRWNHLRRSSWRYILGWTVFIVFMAGLAMTFALAINVSVRPALRTGAVPDLTAVPGGLLMGLLGPLVGRLFDRYGPRWLSTGGATLLVLTMLALTQVTPQTPIALLLGIHLVLSTGLAFLFTPAFTTALNPLPPHLYSHGSAILSTLQQVAGAAGVALLVTIMTLRMTSRVAGGAEEIAAEVAGLHLAFLVAAGIGLVAVGLALSLRRTEAVADPASAAELR